MGYSKSAHKRYFVEVMAAVALVVAFGLSWRHVAQWTSSPVLLFAIKLLPPLGVLFIAAAMWRLYRARDEFQRQTMLKIGAAAMMLSIVFFALFPFLRGLGLPPMQSGFPLAPLVLSTSLMICGLIFSFLDKQVETGTRRALIHIAPFLLVILALTAWWILALVMPLPTIIFRHGMLVFAAVIVAISFYRIFVRPEEQ